MKLHCKVHQSIEKYLLWDETLLPTPGKTGTQLCSRSSRSIILSRAAGCTVYLYTPHHPFLKFPMYILWTSHCDACLCDLPDIVICRHLLCTPVTCAGTPFSQMGLGWKDQWGVLLPLVYGPFKFQLHHFNPLFYCRSLFSLGRNFTFSFFPATKMMTTNSDIIFCFCFLCCIKAFIHFFHMCVQEMCTVVQYYYEWLNLKFCIHFAQSTCTEHNDDDR